MSPKPAGKKSGELPEQLSEYVAASPGTRCVSVHVVGLPPGVLQHNPRGMLVARKLGPGKQIPTPEEEAESSSYRMDNGELYLPAEWFYNCLVYASSQYKAEGKRSSMSSLVAGTIKVWPADGIPLGTDKYEIDMRPVVIQRSRVIRARPHIRKWEVNFWLTWPSTYITGHAEEQIRQILEDGGQRVGVGDYRPQHRGAFGTFRVTGWEFVGED